MNEKDKAVRYITAATVLSAFLAIQGVSAVNSSEQHPSGNILLPGKSEQENKPTTLNNAKIVKNGVSLNLTIKTTAVGKIVGEASTCEGTTPVFNPGFGGFDGADMAGIATAGGKLVLVTGDIIDDQPDCNSDLSKTKHVFGRAVLLSAPLSQIDPDKGIFFTEATSPDTIQDFNQGTNIVSTGYTLSFGGKENTYFSYAKVKSNNGNYQENYYTGIGILVDNKILPYKADILRFGPEFSNISMISDGTHIYFIGTPWRFGGAVLARMLLTNFTDPNNHDSVEYLHDGDIWSTDSTDLKWIISSKDGTYPPATWDYPIQCNNLGVGEQSIMWNQYLQKYTLLSTNICNGKMTMYIADDLKGMGSN